MGSSVLRFVVLGAALVAATSVVAQQPVSESSRDDVLAADALTVADWAGLRTAQEAWYHAVRADADGHVAHNRGQQWTTSFDGQGFLTRPRNAEWTWGLALSDHGRGAARQPASAPREVRSAGPRLEYIWDDTLTEWFLNDGRGLEHGFDVLARPAAELDGPLELRLAILGDLAPAPANGGRDVRFLSASGAHVLNYSGLTVVDAAGAELPAAFTLQAGELLLSVDDRDARYPITIDPVAQQAYIKASNTGASDRFGDGLGISGNTIVVSAPFEDSDAVGVNGTENTDIGFESGAAYVFVNNAGVWSQQAYLKASNTNVGDLFGISAAVSGDTVVIGAPFEDSSATTVNGNQLFNNAFDAGAAYVFVRNAGVWTQQAYLKPDNMQARDGFGFAVAINGDTIVVGSPDEDSNAVGVNGNGADNSAADSGAAYVFVRNAGVWSQQAYLKASNTDAADSFGLDLDIDGDTIVVGAASERSGATGVNGNEADDGSLGAGAAYVFTRAGVVWSQQAYLKASNTGPGDAFAFSVAVSGNTIVVGAPDEDSNETTIDQVEMDAGDDFNFLESGAAYVFTRAAGVWSQQAYIKPSNTDAVDGFGWSAVLDGDLALISAIREDSAAQGVDGAQDNDPAGHGSGAAYAFVRSGTIWSQAAYLKSSNSEAFDVFGDAMGLDAGTLVISASEESSAATGVGGNQADNTAGDSGAVFVFDASTLATSVWTDQGCSLAGAGGNPVLTGVGPLTGGSANSFNLSNAAGSATMALFWALTDTPTPFKGGVLKPTFAPNRLFLNTTSVAGTFVLGFVLPPVVPPGIPVWAQYAIVDGGAPVGVALSNAVRGVFQ